MYKSFDTEFHFVQEKVSVPQEYTMPCENESPAREFSESQPDITPYDEYQAQKTGTSHEESDSEKAQKTHKRIKNMFLMPIVSTVAAVSIIFSSYGFDPLHYDIFGSSGSYYDYYDEYYHHHDEYFDDYYDDYYDHHDDYYDDYGFEDELETIVDRGCDALAIMNYNRDDEIGQIETEAALCSAYGKRLINIYELQEVGKFDLEENHTYRDAGLPALEESAKSVVRRFDGQDITTALHEYRALKDMAGY